MRLLSITLAATAALLAFATLAHAQSDQEMADLANNASLCSGMLGYTLDNNMYGTMPQGRQAAAQRPIWDQYVVDSYGQNGLQQAYNTAADDYQRLGDNYAASVIGWCLRNDPDSIIQRIRQWEYTRTHVGQPQQTYTASTPTYTPPTATPTYAPTPSMESHESDVYRNARESTQQTNCNAGWGKCP
ncbi:MAG TPA: hypothetical protein VHL34_19270 [Rhizomicrobium sp.]|jgi:hypothetical protein|nr:hypothetical protein [Rhizomicrobium sp.]